MKKFGLILGFLCSIVLMLIGFSAISPNLVWFNLVQTEYSEPIDEKIDNKNLETCGPIYDWIHLDNFNLDKSVRSWLNAVFCNNFYAWSLILIFFLAWFSWFIGLILRCINWKIWISFVYSLLLWISITGISIWDIVLSVIRWERFWWDIFMLLIWLIFLIVWIISFSKYCRCALLKKGRPVYAKVIQLNPIKLYSLPSTDVDLDNFLDYWLSSLTTEKCFITFDDWVSLFEECFSWSFAPEITMWSYLPIYYRKDKSSYWIDYHGFKKKEPANYLKKNLDFYWLSESPLRRKLHLLGKKWVWFDIFVLLLVLVFWVLLLILWFTWNESWYSTSNLFAYAFWFIFLVSSISLLLKTIKKINLNNKIKQLKHLKWKYLKIESISENRRVLWGFRSYFLSVTDWKNSFKSENFSTNNIHDLLMVWDSVMFYQSEDNPDVYFIDIEDCKPTEKWDSFIANEKQNDEKENMDKKINKVKWEVWTVIDDVRVAKKILKK